MIKISDVAVVVSTNCLCAAKLRRMADMMDAADVWGGSAVPNERGVALLTVGHEPGCPAYPAAQRMASSFWS